jgi:hypothetical protein
MGQNRDLQRAPQHRQSAIVAGTRSYFFQKIQAILTLKLSLLHTVFTDAEDKLPVYVQFARYKACCEALLLIREIQVAYSKN